jgi:LmbE family N-acetylglucosaminyl deacetylase
MYELDLTSSRRSGLKVLCLGAHSDDIEIGCGGLILSLVARHKAVDIDWVVFSAPPGRDKEARRSAEMFLRGARRKRILLKKFRDGFFPFDGGKIKTVFEQLKPSKPDLVLTHYRDDRHQDHRAISDLAWNTFRDHWILEYEIPKYDGDLGTPNCFLPLDQPTCARKIEYLTTAFGSQRDKHWFSSETFMGLMRLRGMECRAPHGYAEAFYSRKITLNLSSATGD